MAVICQFSGICASGITPIIAAALTRSGGNTPRQMYVLFAGMVSTIGAWMIGDGEPVHSDGQHRDPRADQFVRKPPSTATV